MTATPLRVFVTGTARGARSDGGPGPGYGLCMTTTQDQPTDVERTQTLGTIAFGDPRHVAEHLVETPLVD